jgi:hypothetical protein
MRIDVRTLSRTIAHGAIRGCVPELPAPGCWPERREREERLCLPALDRLLGGTTARRPPAGSRPDRSRDARRR